jgi:hypothetical protein
VARALGEMGAKARAAVPALRKALLDPDAGAQAAAVGLVREVKPAGQIVHELVGEARQIIAQRLAGLVATGAGRG